MFHDEECLNYNVSTVKQDLNADDVEGTDTPLPDVCVKPSSRAFYEQNQSQVSVSHF